MSETQILEPGEQLPETIESKLRRMVRRARFVIAVRGICPVVTVLVLGLLLVMAVDATVTFMPHWPRWLMTLGVLGLTAATAVVFLVRPLARSLTLAGIARALEARHPELQERISSAVELLRSGDEEELLGSRALIAALVQEASHDVEGLLPRREVTLRRARPLLAAALLSVALMGGLLALMPQQSSRLLARAAAPFLNLPNVAAYDLTVTPGDAVIRPGDNLEVEVKVAHRRAGAARLHLTDARGRRSVLTMDERPAPEGRQRFALLCPSTRQGFRYRIRAGDALTRYYRVDVVPPPMVRGMEARFDYPDYGYLEPREEPEFTGEISAVVGTHVSLRARLNKPVARAALHLRDREEPFAEGRLVEHPDGTADAVFEFELEPDLTGTWWLEATDEHGFTNARELYPIETLPDGPPQVRVLHPRRRRLTVRPGETIPVLYAMRDDLGIARAEMLLVADEQEADPAPIALPPDGPERMNIVDRKDLDLADPDLRGAREVQFQLRVADGLPPERGGPQEALSRVFTVRIRPEALPYAEQVRTMLEEDIRRALEEVKEELEAAGAGSDELLEALEEEPPAAEDMRRRLGSMMDHLVTAERSTRELERRVAEGTYAPLAPRLAELADDYIVAAEDAVEQIALSRTDEDRRERTEETDERIDAAVDAVEALLEEFDRMVAAMERLSALQAAAALEQELAHAAAQMEDHPDDAPMSPEDWDAAQEELVADVGRLLEQTPWAHQLHALLQEERTRDLAAEARRLQEEQVGLAADTGQVAALPELDRELEELAEEQAALAEEAASRESTAEHRDPMADAADDIRHGELEEAVRTQSEEESHLREAAARMAIDRFEEEAREQAHELARRQRAIADRIASEDEEQPADEQAAVRGGTEELAESLAQSVPPARRALEEHDPRGPMHRAEEALRGDSPEEAGRAAAEAADRIEQLAAALDGLPEEGEWTSDLAARQRDLRDRTRELADRREAARRQLEESLFSRIGREQAEVAEQAEALADRVAERRPQHDELERRAAEEARRAAREMEARRLPHAAREAEEAARDLGELAGRLDAASRQEVRDALEADDVRARTPDIVEGRRLADDASRLAERQEHLADAMHALGEERTLEMLASWQEHLRHETGALGEETARLQEPLLPFLPPDEMQQAAAEAAAELGQAEQSQQHAEAALAEHAPGEAGPPQDEAAAGLGRAAEALDRMSELYAEAAEATPGFEDHLAEHGQALADAHEAAAEAAATSHAADAAAAAGMLAEAAAHAHAHLGEMGLQPYSFEHQLAAEAVPGPTSDPRSGRGLPLEPTAEQLAETELTLEDWARLPSELRSEILQAADRGGPEEYRDLIRQYFRELARLGLQDTDREVSE